MSYARTLDMPAATALQPGILRPPSQLGRSLSFRLAYDADPRAALARLREAFDPARGVVGVGAPLVAALGRTIAGLRPFPALAGPGGSVPSTQQALWLFLHAADRSALFDAAAPLLPALAEVGLVVEDAMDTFVYAGGRDLTGFEDGTENPKGEAARAAVLAEGGVPAGSSFVAVQRWVHDLRRFGRFPAERQDAVIGRRREGNDEIEDAPRSAHVKRTAQESFEPPGFMVRRSMPFESGGASGLEFIAFVASLDRFERMLERMLGRQDGIVDGLFSFSRPVTGGYYFCPPVSAGRLDLAGLGL
jgi:putative iron-dependent peroxidase